MDLIHHTNSPHACDQLACEERQVESDRRAEQRQHALPAYSAEWKAEESRLVEAAHCARMRNTDLGQLTFLLHALRSVAAKVDADDITPVVQEWIDKYMPMKQDANDCDTEAMYALRNFVLTGRK